VAYLLLPRSALPDPISNLSDATLLSNNNNNESTNPNAHIFDKIIIPKIVHQMWKDTPSNIPHELQRWRQGCMAVNREYNFQLSMDDELRQFVHTHYPEYTELFDNLHGVYMADMARVLLVYHYGGIYMDLDFYCHKPFHCLLNGHVASYLKHRPEAGNLLIVSLEPLVHAHLFRNKSRVVIQDFYMATAKHPFLKWLLEDRNAHFKNEKAAFIAEYGISNYNGSGTSISTAPTQLRGGVSLAGHFTKGPFSYSIEKDIDRYYDHLASFPYSPVTQAFRDSTLPVTSSSKNRHRHRRQLKQTIIESNSDLLSNSTKSISNRQLKPRIRYRKEEEAVYTGPPVGHILELPERVLHPLVDRTNSKLDICSDRASDASTRWRSSCNQVTRKQFFHPARETVAVHMWTHVYLGWNFIRTAYSRFIYIQVENELPPTLSCNSD
jgi:hypothetical protein